MKIIRLPIVLTFVLALTQFATADLITAQYNFDGNSASPTSPGDANTLISPYNANPALLNSGITNEQAFMSTAYAAGAASLAVHEFTLTPLKASSSMHFDALSELVFDYQIAGFFPPFQSYSVSISTSVDNHAVSLGTITGDPNGLVIPGTVSLASLGTQTGPVTIRFTFDDSTAGTTTQHTLDNISLSFNSVPEPAAAMLFGFLAVIGLGFRNRDQ